MKHLVFVLGLVVACGPNAKDDRPESIKNTKIRLIIDSDANNELDDQHALAYALLNEKTFDVEGITINNTKYGDGITGHYQEALRVMALCRKENAFPVLKGASGSYSAIEPSLTENDFDGKEAVDFIIQQAKRDDPRPLVLVPIGKLTNIALALTKAPEIKNKIRVVWLGSNYPDAGEYNLENDTTSINPVIQSGVAFEMVVVRYGQRSGTDVVRVTKEQVHDNLKGRGVVARQSTTGRHGGEFKTFGDYSVNLFEHAQMHGDPPSRALFDLAAIAVLKNPRWAERVEIPAPILNGFSWKVDSSAVRSIVIWENFKRDSIVSDFFSTIQTAEKKNNIR